MNKYAKYMVVMIFAVQVFISYAQSSEKTEPQFTLTISEYHHEFGPALDRINVKETNISQEVIIDPGCAGERGFITSTVLYNSLPLKEKDAARRHHWEKHYSEFCTSGGGIIKPGESIQHLVSLAFKYDLSRPGTYDIFVTMESDPYHPEKSVTVKSNTITVIIPEPEASATQQSVASLALET